jgi:hypothetical protein
MTTRLGEPSKYFFGLRGCTPAAMKWWQPEVKLTSVRVKNYKGHFDTGEIGLGSRFTVLVGQNSAGKTA